MTPDLHVRRLRNQYRIHASAPVAGDLQARFDAIARWGLGDAVHALLPAVLGELGISAEAEVVVRRLGVRVRLRGEDIDDGELGRAWAQAVADALRQVLRPLAGKTEGETDRAAVFPDRPTAERRWLAALARGVAPSWWVAPLLAAGGTVPSAETVVARWIEAHPAQAPTWIHAAFSTGPRGLEALVGDAAAKRLLVALAHTWGVAVKPDGDAASATAIQRRLARGLRSLSPVEMAALGRACARIHGPHQQALLALSLLLSTKQRPPQLTVRALAEAVKVVSETPVDPRDGALPWSLAAQAEAAAPPLDMREEVQQQGTWDAAPSSRAPSPATGTPASFPVHVGGLLFLLRPALRALRGEHDPQPALLGLGWRVLDQLFAPLPDAARHAAFEHERPLLEAFSGVELLPEDLTRWPVGPHLRAATDAHLAHIQAQVDPGLEPYAPGLRRLYGPDVGPPPALAALALRPGQLQLTPTHADLFLPPDSVAVRLRMGGWDLDPGWVPEVGRVLRFHYEDR